MPCFHQICWCAKIQIIDDGDAPGSFRHQCINQMTTYKARSTRHQYMLTLYCSCSRNHVPHLPNVTAYLKKSIASGASIVLEIALENAQLLFSISDASIQSIQSKSVYSHTNT